MAKNTNDNLPNQSANKYYASKSISTVRRSRHDNTAPIATPAIVDPKVSIPTGGRSADQYYASYKPKGAKTPAPSTGRVAELALLDKMTIREEVGAAIERAKEGLGSQLTFATSDGLRQARVQLELAVTREALTEEQARTVRLAAVPADTRVEVATTEAGLVTVTDPAIKDMLAIEDEKFIQAVNGVIGDDEEPELPRGAQSLEPWELSKADAEFIAEVKPHLVPQEAIPGGITKSVLVDAIQQMASKPANIVAPVNVDALPIPDVLDDD